MEGQRCTVRSGEHQGSPGVVRNGVCIPDGLRGDAAQLIDEASFEPTGDAADRGR